jgi:flagellar biosynthesis/type III secretory pathway protein FliH
MPETLTIHLVGPVAAVRVVDGPDPSPRVQSGEREIRDPKSDVRDLERQSEELAQLCALVGGIADRLGRLHEQTIAHHRSDIAALAVEIARKVLTQRVANGDYDIQAVVEEALKRAPTQQNIVVRVNPQDLPSCQKLQQDNPDGPWAALEFVADRSIARADCLVETPKGIVKSFVEQHLERIGEALTRVE